MREKRMRVFSLLLGFCFFLFSNRAVSRVYIFFHCTATGRDLHDYRQYRRVPPARGGSEYPETGAILPVPGGLRSTVLCITHRYTLYSIQDTVYTVHTVLYTQSCTLYRYRFIYGIPVQFNERRPKAPYTVDTPYAVRHEHVQ